MPPGPSMSWWPALPSLLLLLVSHTEATGGATLREQLGYPLDDPGMLYRDDPNLVKQIILMNPSQQIQSDDVIIRNWTIQWEYLFTKVKLQLWRQTGLSPGHFTLQSETAEMTSNRTGKVTFGTSYSLVAQHGDILGIYLMSRNPIPYRKPVGECIDRRTMVWQRTYQDRPVPRNTSYVFQTVVAGDLCRHYLIEPHFELLSYGAGMNRKLFGNDPVERAMTDTDGPLVIVPNPALTLPPKSVTLGWQAYFAKPLTKVRFSVLTPNGTDQWQVDYVSAEYMVTQIGVFYARISHLHKRILPEGAVIALNFTGDNPIPYDVSSTCSEETTSLYQSVQQTMVSERFSMNQLDQNPCRQYSFQLEYEKFEARYPGECRTVTASTTLQESKTFNYDKGIVYSSTKDCWQVYAQTVGGAVLEIEVLDLDLRPGDCGEDGENLLEIRDGASRDGPLLKRVCPGERNVTVTSCSNGVHIYLKTTDSTGRRGLKFSYIIVSKENRPCPLVLPSKSSASSMYTSLIGTLSLSSYILYFIIHNKQ